MKNNKLEIQEVETNITKENFEKAKDLFKEGKEMLQGFQELGNIYNESKRLDNENLKIKGEIVNKAKQFQQTQFILEGIFSERRDTINKHFEIIDRGLREGNDELMLAGLKLVGDFVTTNPLGSFDSFMKILDDDNEILMLDF